MGGIAVYPNEFNKALSAMILENPLSSNMENGRLLLDQYRSKSIELVWRILLGGLRRISDSPFSVLGSIGYGLIQRFLTIRFNRHKKSRNNVIYHHMNNFVLPELALIRLAKRHNVFIVTTIVDLLEVDYPQFLPKSTNIFRSHLKKFLKSSTYYFIPITNFIKKDSIDSGLISGLSSYEIIEWGTNHLGTPDLTVAVNQINVDTEPDANLHRPFFLFPAKSWAHKGHLKFLEAYAANNLADFRVTLIGDIEPLRAEIETLVLSMGTKGTKNINILGFVDDKTREQLMNDCLAVILPSCYEGFGFPYFEATFLKKALVSFRTKSFLEFFGNDENSLSVPNLDYDAFIQALIDFDEKDAELETKRKFNRIQVLSWESCLLRTLGVYSRILEEIS
jgi:glycosyltransferase involved in cell wall biosynthesis